ncbi:16S rRNA (guanine(527)-N(7))-methyltransferase RsmG [Caldichromatium japonicum]|uniref:Ribosomal RNA small subunit methyltransferase G n=1 Tax=Caldichromatium japonicum TaxID=2699430 RepID=A0A6G7VFS0_9GAMM|nr:16S rRNA (guanine(527)-N(7))-methyltransferase RsmG [Caldichromatium japonicum]QIK38871.1 16S rRNA (guanine(527)-N(7))-methyltransferase RsmG [Caldichromatium japonicum]
MKKTSTPPKPDWQLIEDRLSVGLAVLRLPATDGQRACLIDLLRLLVRWNQAYNLTAVRDPFEMVARHLLDSLAVAPFIAGETVLDVGTGPGLPGLPLAIVLPQWHFWLLDSNGKKIRFVRQAALELGLVNVEAVHARIETYRTGQKFSTIISRAVAAEAILGVFNADLMASAGRLLLMKARLDPSVDELAQAGYRPFIHPLRIPFLDAPRHLIELRSA